MIHFLSVCGFLYIHAHASPLVTMKAGQHAVVGEIRNGLYPVQKLTGPGNSNRDNEADMQIHGVLCWVSNTQMVEGIVLSWSPMLG